MTTRYAYKTVSELRAAFWRDHPYLPRYLITDYSGKGKMYPTDTRVAWTDWIDYLHRDGMISSNLAERATL